MTTASIPNTWDITGGSGGPRRPSLEDVGGATLVDDDEDPPDPETMPYAAQLNQLQMQASAQGKVCDFIAFSVQFSGGTPSIAAVTAPGTDIVIGTLSPTDFGVGNTRITWPANTFPPPLLKPTGTINEDVGELVGISVVPITGGVEVRTYRATGGAADLAFTVRYQ